MTIEQEHYKPGQRVEYTAVKGQSVTTGVIKDVVTEDAEVSGRTFHPGSKERPRYVIVNDHTKHEFVYSEDMITKSVGEASESQQGQKQGGKGGQSSGQQYKFKQGEKVSYYPTGASTVTTVGTILSVESGEGHADGEARYTIKNDHTQKETTYKESNLIEKAE